LELGEILGKGGFCTVSKISNITLYGEDPVSPLGLDSSAAHIIQDRAYMAANHLRDGKDSRYALKTLRSSLMKDPERFVAGVIDLVIETKFLAVIRHPVSQYSSVQDLCNCQSIVS
jgi:hypothetical protein